MIVESLVYGFQAMFWVGVLMLLFNCEQPCEPRPLSVGPIVQILDLPADLEALVGIMLFRKNDPFHFMDLQSSFVTLWRIETFGTWEHVLLINMYGCDNYGYGVYMTLPVKCKTPQALGYWATIYFIFLVTFGGLVLPTLLVAVITTSSFDAENMINARTEMEERTHENILAFPKYMTEARVDLFLEVFQNLDVVSPT